MAWIYLFIASCFEIAWLYSVKLFSKDKIAAINWADFFTNSDGFQALAPALGYVGFGICQILFFAAAMKTLPASTAFAVWTGVTLIGTKIVDTTYFKEPVSPVQLLFFGFILAGIIGLRFKTP